MTDVSTFEDIEMPADAVWDVIGDLGGIRKWAVLVQSESVEDTPSGKVRTLIMPEDRVVKERLVVQSQYSYTYVLKWPTTAQPLRSSRSMTSIAESR